MSELGYALALGLAAVFAWAGAAKLRAPARTARSFRALGLPEGLARIVPVVELALAALLVSKPITAVAAALMLALFTIVLVGADDGVTCACFGGGTGEPVSWVQVVRNVLLMLVAVGASFGRPLVPGIAAVLTATGIGMLTLVVLALADLKRRVGAVVAVELP